MARIIEVRVPRDGQYQDYPWPTERGVMNARILSLTESALTESILSDPRNEILMDGRIYGIHSYKKKTGSGGNYYEFHIQDRRSVAARCGNCGTQGIPLLAESRHGRGLICEQCADAEGGVGKERG